MVDCATMLMSYVHDSARVADMLQTTETTTSCLQWNATIAAGVVQARAATRLGYMTLGAGGFALLAAGVALLGIYFQHRNLLKKDKIDRVHALKRDSLILAAEAFTIGMHALGRLADVRMESARLLEAYNNASPKFARVTLTARRETAKAALEAVQALTVAQTEVQLKRVPIETMLVSIKSFSELRAVEFTKAESLIELMRQYNIRGEEDKDYFSRLDKQYKFNVQQYTSFDQKIAELWTNVQTSQRELSIYIIGKLRLLYPHVLEALLEFREELDLSVERKEFTAMMMESAEAGIQNVEAIMREAFGNKIETGAVPKRET